MIGLFMLLLVLVFQPPFTGLGETMPTITLPPGIDLPGRLAFTQREQLYLHDFTTGHTSHVPLGTRVLTPLWLPDGQQAAVLTEDRTIGVYRLADATFRTLVDERSRLTAWHPDGQRLLYVQNNVGTLEYDLATGQSQRLLPWRWRGTAWARDGHTLLLLGDVPGDGSTRFDPTHVFTLDTRTCRDAAGRYNPDVCAANVVQRTHEGHVNGSPALNRDGTRLVFSRQIEEFAVGNTTVLHDLLTGEERVLISGRRVMSSFVWGPDERWIMSVGTVPGELYITDVVLIDVTSGETHQLTTGGAFDVDWWWPANAGDDA